MMMMIMMMMMTIIDFKVKCTLEQATKAQKGSRRIGLLFL